MLPQNCPPISVLLSPASAYQEGTEHVEADEVEDSKAATTGRLPLRAVAGLRLGGTLLAWHTGQHDILPGFPGGTPRQERQESPTSAGHSHPCRQGSLSLTFQEELLRKN